MACPVQPGTEFYGVVPAPPPPSKAALNAAAAASIPNIDMTPTATLQLCARLISSANDCVNGQSDRMRYTVSECIDQDAATAGTLPKVQTVFEGQSIITVISYFCRYHLLSPLYIFVVIGGLTEETGLWTGDLKFSHLFVVTIILLQPNKHGLVIPMIFVFFTINLDLPILLERF